MIGWLDVQAGAAGDMLLGALVDAGVPLGVLQEQLDVLDLGLTLVAEAVQRAGLGATRIGVRVGADDAESAPAPHRTWADVRTLLDRLDEPVRSPAQAVFRRLAQAEAQVHRVSPDEVHFHEVGALDALADVVGVVAGLQHLGLTRLTASPVALGAGTSRGAHGPLPVPAPAVLALLAGAPVQAGAAAHEATTPTGAALLATLVDGWGPLPELRLVRTGTGAGGRDLPDVANVTRLVLGEPAHVGTALLLETNVDDLDPRLWPLVLQRLLDAGASDAWLTPILMKKGRPAHTLSVLVPQQHAPAVRAVVFRETTTLGLREISVGKHALDRTTSSVEVGGRQVRVKHGWYDSELVTSTPEWDDVAAAAEATGRPAKDVLREAQTSAKKPSAPAPPASGTPTLS